MQHLISESPLLPVQLIRARWKGALGAAIAGAVIALAVAVLMPAEYVAELKLVTVENGAGGMKLPGAAAGLLNLQRGLEASPALVARLARLRSVLEEVADSTITENGLRRTIVQQAFPRDDVKPYERAKYMEKLVRTSSDRESGIISLQVAHRDSAVARHAAQLLVSGISRAFARISRAQGSELRQAQEDRLRVASENLRAAEERVAEFSARNRMVPDYSPLQLEKKRLDRAADIARNVYMQAVTDRETAVSKELEDAPALVVVDSLPRTMSPESRQIGLKVSLGALAAAMLYVLVMWLVDASSAGRRHPAASVVEAE